MSSITDMVQALLGRPATVNTNPAPGPTYLTEQPKNYPTSEDVAFARKNEFGYGQPWERYFTGHEARVINGDPNNLFRDGREIPTRHTTGVASGLDDDYYGRAALAVQNSALGMLGFDPNRTAADMSRDPRRVNLLGGYHPSSDQMYANARDPSAIVHESIHRGVKKLSETPYWKPEFGGLDDEMVVRWLMEKKMGDPEAELEGPAGKSERETARILFGPKGAGPERLKALEDMEMAASQYMAAKRPGGPR